MDEYNPQFEEQKTDAANENINSPTFEQPGVSAIPHSYVTFIPYGFTPKTYEEKNGIRKRALAIGLSLIITLAVSSVWSIVYLFIMGKLGFTSEKAMEIVQNPAIMQVLQVCLSILMFTVPFIIMFRANGMRISDLVPLEKPRRGNRAAMYFIGVAFCAFANIATSMASQFFQFFGIEYNVDFGETPKGFFGFLLCLFATVVVPALVEEFAFRGLILGLLRKYGDGFAVLVSSFLFGFMHGNFEQMPFAFLVGIALGFIAVKTNSLLLAMAVHATNNFVSVIFDFMPSSIPQTAQNIIYSVFLFICLTLGILALALSENSGEMFKFRKTEVESVPKQRFKWFFTSPVIIIFIVICIAESLVYF